LLRSEEERKTKRNTSDNIKRKVKERHLLIFLIWIAEK